MSWYSGPIRFIGNSPSARGYERIGRKLLGVLEEREKAGVMTGSLRRELENGTVVEVSKHGMQRSITVTTTEKGGDQFEEIVDNVEGFVTWPHAADGSLTLPRSGLDNTVPLDVERAILAMRNDSLKMHGVGRSSYIQKFPDSEECRSMTGAGNVDWEGNGWRLSWYGPRGRYLDNASPRKKFVFFKGQILKDTTAAGVDVVGAAVFTSGIKSWLILVTTSYYNNGREIFSIPIIGKPADPVVTLDDDAAIYLGGYYNPFFSELFGHPWFFNPDGLIGKTIARGQFQTRNEITATIVLLNGEPDSVNVDVVVIPKLPYSTRGYGFVSHTGSTKIAAKGFWHDFELPKSVVVGVLPAYFQDNDNSGPDGTATVQGTNTSHTGQMFIYQNGAHGGGFYLSNTVYKPNIAIASGEVWQKTAVDFDPDGLAVYAYARLFTTDGSDTTVQSISPDEIITTGIVVDEGAVTVEWYSGSIAATEWAVTVKYSPVGNYAANPTSHTVDAARTVVQNDVIAGIKLGELSFLSTYDYESNHESSNNSSVAGYAGTPSDGEVAVLNQTYPSNMNDTIIFRRRAVTGSNGYTTQTFNASADSTTVEVNAEVICMDLRHDAIFVATCTNTVTTTTTVGGSRWSLQAGQGAAITHQDTRLEKASWAIQGYVKGVKVYEKLLPDSTISNTDNSYVRTVPEWGTTMTVPGFTAGATGTPTPTQTNLSGPVLWVWSKPYAGAPQPAQGPTTAETDPFGGGSDYQQVAVNRLNGLDPSSAVANHFLMSSHADNTQYGYMTASQTTTTNVFGFDYDASRRMRWVNDKLGVPVFGGFVFTKTRWLVSFALPVPTNSTFEYANLTNCIGDPLKLAKLKGPLPAHLFPLWYLESTKMPIPQKRRKP